MITTIKKTVIPFSFSVIQTECAQRCSWLHPTDNEHNHSAAIPYCKVRTEEMRVDINFVTSYEALAVLYICCVKPELLYTNFQFPGNLQLSIKKYM